MRLPAAIVLGLLLAGCASSPTRFWTIEPAPPLAALLTAATTAPVQIAAVHLPLALDRLEVVRHDEADRIEVLDFDRWSAPPGSLMRTALTQDLAALLPAGRVVFPEAPTPPNARRIVVDVLDLRRTADGYAMQVSWSLLPQPGRSRQLSLAAPGSDDVAGQTRAISAMIGQLASDIAASS